MLILIVFYLWDLLIIITTIVAGQQHIQTQTFDITIGGVFTDRDEGTETQSMENIFKYAIFHYNRLAKEAHNLSFKIRIKEETLSLIAAESAVQTVHDVCSLVHQRHVQGIFGPPYPELATLVHSICYHVDIPFINVCSSCYDVENPDEEPNDYIEQIPRRDRMSINLYPSNQDLNIAFHNLTHKLQWTKFLIIYDIDSGLTRLQKLLNDPGVKQTDILVRQFTHYKDRSVLTDAIGRDISNIILDLNDINTRTVLKMALQMGMINSNYHYILTTLNIDTFDLEDYKYNYVNLTAFRLFNRRDSRVVMAMESFFAFKTMSNNEVNRRLFTTSVALWADALLAFAYAYDKLIASQIRLGVELIRPNISCIDGRGWPLGIELHSKFNQISFDGITGKVKFTSNGERTGFELDVVHLSESGISKIGTWSREFGANFTLTPSARGGLFNSTLIVTTIVEPPYVMFKNNQNLTNPFSRNYTNSDFEGFCVDLLEQMSRILKFRYKIKPITTLRYDDMVEEIKAKRADLAVAPLTISYAREKQIDFTKPFLSFGIAILFKLPKAEKAGLFSFLSPLSLEIWIYTFAAVFTVSFILLLIARCSPDEWRNPYPCDTEYDILENRFTVSNTLWFSIGTLMQQGSDVSPSAISTRLVSGIWWFFTLILISSYTANLAAFLTVEKLNNPIESAEDLAKQANIKYGVVRGGSTEQFFRESSIPTFQTMWKYMSNNPDVFVNTNQQGIERVKAGSYAFLMESTSIEYTIHRDRNLTQIGGFIDNKGYGIGLPDGSPYRERFSEIILDLQERGIIQTSYNKWWKGTGTCTSEKKDTKANPNPLDLTNVGGIFVVLLGGVFLSLLVAILEFLWHARKNHENRRHSVWWELIKELRFSIQCGASNRKALVARRCSQCTVDDDDVELNEIPQTNQLLHRTHSNRSSSSISVNTGSNLQVPKRRTTTERTAESDKFDTLLMLAAERTNYLDNRRKKYFHDSHIDRKHRHLSASPQRKDIPLVLIEKHASNDERNVRSHQVHFSTDGDSPARSSLRIPHYEDDDGDPNAADVSSGSTSSMNLRPLPRVSRLKSMSLLLQQQNSNIKPKRSVTNLPTKTEIEFRWSILAAKIALQDETSLTTLHTIDLNSPKKKSFLSSQSSTARSFTTNQSSLLAQNLLPRSPRLSNVNNINKTKELSTDQNDDERKSPLILTYSQLHRAQQQSKQNETSQTTFSMLCGEIKNSFLYLQLECLKKIQIVPNI
ncbi:unnamed protein product [Rotaria sp. Silwood2]|nr:unnamed protein product [Rotaria sp. Silwood2]